MKLKFICLEYIQQQKLNLELSKNREKIQSQLEKERAEIVRKSEETSARLATEAERRYKEEMAEYRREQQLQLELIAAQAESKKLP